MRCPNLAELPPPPAGRSGWPWTEETPPLPPARPDGSAWPRISIVTPSFNQGRFIEETIRSILLQGYPDLEYIVIDGGSTDESVAVIRKYEPWLAYWASETDRGQAHAINKGLARCTGEIFQWINSDDLLLPGAMRFVAQTFRGNIVAAPIRLGQRTTTRRTYWNVRLDLDHLLTNRALFAQQGVWIPRMKLINIGINDRLHYIFDWELIIRYLEKFPSIDYVGKSVAFFRLHQTSKTIKLIDSFEKERRPVLIQLSQSLTSPRRREFCRQYFRKSNWRKHLIDLAGAAKGKRIKTAVFMLFLMLRNPRERFTYSWMRMVARALTAVV